MTSQNLENLTRTGQLKNEPPDQREFDGLVRSARARLKDSRSESLALESRFDLAYNASYALALAALRWPPCAGTAIAPDSRFIVFQCIRTRSV